MPISLEGLPGQVLQQRYRLREQIADGGMGVIFLADRLDGSGTVAVKVLRPEFVSHGTIANRFIREAQLLSLLKHPNTVTVFHYGTDPALGVTFLAMEYIHGASLFQFVRDRHTLDLHQAVEITLQILLALGDAHQKGILHRDLKPGNVMITRTAEAPLLIKVLDFGLAKVFAPQALPTEQRMVTLTKTGEVLGTLHYMAPEQIRGQELTAAADLYAVAVIFFFMLAGRRPFEGKKNAQLLASQLSKPFPRLSVPANLQDLLDKAAAKEPGERFQSAEEFADALRRAMLEGEDTQITLDPALATIEEDRTQISAPHFLPEAQETMTPSRLTPRRARKKTHAPDDEGENA
jgi:serine/threonine-protein kinase